MTSLDNDDVVFRHVHANAFPEDDDRPLPVAFLPSTKDEKEGETRGAPVELSVWDSSRTTDAQAAAIRVADGGTPGRPYCVTVGVVRALSEPGELALDVFRTPRAIAMPGAGGHCSITGLGKRDHIGNPQVRKRYMRKLAEHCQPGVRWRDPPRS